MSPTADSSKTGGSARDDLAPDWEAFYSDYRKPGYVEGFEITSKLGGGMFGLVFRARRMSIGKDYAIKFLKVDDGEVRKAVLSELEQVKYFAQIDHPNLVSIEDRGEVDGIPYLVMAFAGSETLRDKMPGDADGGRVPSAAEKDELLLAFLQCCRGLQALHERSLVHFDIKPANVFLKGGVARLGDYGLSKLVTHSRGSLSMGRGTPYYMAPEMLRRRGDARSDIYSLGVMLYEILCGKLPFKGDSEWEVLKKHETAQPDLPAHLTPVERAVLERCLAKDPADRYQAVEHLLAAFGAAGVATAAALPRQAAVAAPRPAIAVEPPPLPGCLPPPLASPPTVTRSRRAARTERPPARTGAGAGFLILFAVVFAVTMVMFLMVGGASRLQADEAIVVGGDGPREITSSARTGGSGLAQNVDALVRKVLKDGRRAAQRNRPTRLRTLDLKAVDAPGDLKAYREVLRPLVQSPMFESALADQLERYGRPVLLCSVAMLQEFDYQDELECRSAANLQLFLRQLTALESLAVDVTGTNPSPSETCMFCAVADGWRQVAERFAASDAAFEQLLTATGKQARELR